MTEKEFKIGIAYLRSFYGEIDDDKYQAYWKVLSKYNNEQFKKMLESIVSTFRPTAQVPFPLPPDFLEAIGQTGRNRAILALNAVKDAVESRGTWYSVDFQDPALHATIKNFGGWPEVCSWGNLGEWKYRDKAFMEAYEAAVDCGLKADPPAGNFEIENAKKDQSTWTPIQIAFAEKNSKPLKIAWAGIQQIENKTDSPLAIGAKKG